VEAVGSECGRLEALLEESDYAKRSNARWLGAVTGFASRRQQHFEQDRLV